MECGWLWGRFFTDDRLNYLFRVHSHLCSGRPLANFMAIFCMTSLVLALSQLIQVNDSASKPTALIYGTVWLSIAVLFLLAVLAALRNFCSPKFSQRDLSRRGSYKNAMNLQASPNEKGKSRSTYSFGAIFATLLLNLLLAVFALADMILEIITAQHQSPCPGLWQCFLSIITIYCCNMQPVLCSIFSAGFITIFYTIGVVVLKQLYGFSVLLPMGIMCCLLWSHACGAYVQCSLLFSMKRAFSAARNCAALKFDLDVEHDNMDRLISCLVPQSIASDARSELSSSTTQKYMSGLKLCTADGRKNTLEKALCNCAPALGESHENVTLFVIEICNFWPAVWLRCGCVDAARFLNELVGRIDAALLARQCTRVRMSGERILCMSGGPDQKCPEHAANAVYAAFDAADLLGWASALCGFADLRSRISVHTVTKKVAASHEIGAYSCLWHCAKSGGKRSAYDIIGADVNVVERMVDAAALGSVMISESVLNLLDLQQTQFRLIVNNNPQQTAGLPYNTYFVLPPNNRQVRRWSTALPSNLQQIIGSRATDNLSNRLHSLTYAVPLPLSKGSHNFAPGAATKYRANVLAVLNDQCDKNCDHVGAGKRLTPLGMSTSKCFRFRRSKGNSYNSVSTGTACSSPIGRQSANPEFIFAHSISRGNYFRALLPPEGQLGKFTLKISGDSDSNSANLERAYVLTCGKDILRAAVCSFSCLLLAAAFHVLVMPRLVASFVAFIVAVTLLFLIIATLLSDHCNVSEVISVAFREYVWRARAGQTIICLLIISLYSVWAVVNSYGCAPSSGQESVQIWGSSTPDTKIQTELAQSAVLACDNIHLLIVAFLLNICVFLVFSGAPLGTSFALVPGAIFMALIQAPLVILMAQRWSSLGHSVTLVCIEVVTSMLCCIVLICTAGMHVERCRRVQFLCTFQVEEERSKVKDLQRTNYRLLANILPAHVASFFGNNASAPDIYSCGYSTVAVLAVHFRLPPPLISGPKQKSGTVPSAALLLSNCAHLVDSILSETCFSSVEKVQFVGQVYVAAIGLAPDTKIQDGIGLSRRGAISTLLTLADRIQNSVAQTSHQNNSPKRTEPAENSPSSSNIGIGIHMAGGVAAVVGADRPIFDLYGPACDGARSLAKMAPKGITLLTSDSRAAYLSIPNANTDIQSVSPDGRNSLFAYIGRLHCGAAGALDAFAYGPQVNMRYDDQHQHGPTGVVPGDMNVSDETADCLKSSDGMKQSQSQMSSSGTPTLIAAQSLLGSVTETKEQLLRTMEEMQSSLPGSDSDGDVLLAQSLAGYVNGNVMVEVQDRPLSNATTYTEPASLPNNENDQNAVSSLNNSTADLEICQINGNNKVSMVDGAKAAHQAHSSASDERSSESPEPDMKAATSENKKNLLDINNLRHDFQQVHRMQRMLRSALVPNTTGHKQESYEGDMTPLSLGSESLSSSLEHITTMENTGVSMLPHVYDVPENGAKSNVVHKPPKLPAHQQMSPDISHTGRAHASPTKKTGGSKKRKFRRALPEPATTSQSDLEFVQEMPNSPRTRRHKAQRNAQNNSPKQPNALGPVQNLAHCNQHQNAQMNFTSNSMDVGANQYSSSDDESMEKFQQNFGTNNNGNRQNSLSSRCRQQVMASAAAAAAHDVSILNEDSTCEMNFTNQVNKFSPSTVPTQPCWIVQKLEGQLGTVTQGTHSRRRALHRNRAAVRKFRRPASATDYENAIDTEDDVSQNNFFAPTTAIPGYNTAIPHQQGHKVSDENIGTVYLDDLANRNQYNSGSKPPDLDARILHNTNSLPRNGGDLNGERHFRHSTDPEYDNFMGRNKRHHSDANRSENRPRSQMTDTSDYVDVQLVDSHIKQLTKDIEQTFGNYSGAK